MHLSGPFCNCVTVLRRMLNRRLAAGIWILSLLGLFTISHLALVRVERTSLSNKAFIGFQNSTIERLLQRLMVISDHSICGDSASCVTRADQSDLKSHESGGELSHLTSRTEYGDGENGDASVNGNGDMESLGGASRNANKEDGDESVAKVVLPERDEVSHPDQYQKDVAKRLSSTWTEEESAAQKELFRQRSVSVEEICKSMKRGGVLSPKMGPVFENMRWLTKHNFLWCPIFKAASTTWVKNLLMMAGESKVHEKSLHARVRQLYGTPEDPRTRNRLLKESQKMLIVRHPLERILSAYRDKMLRVRHAHDPHVKIQQEILRLYPDPDPDGPSSSSSSTRSTTKASSSSKSKKEKVMPTTHPTFTQFLMKVRDDLKKAWKNEKKSIVNMHWRPFWLTCAPCQIPYDFIAKVETLDLDQEYIIREMGLQDLLYNARTHSSNFDSYNTTSEAAKDYFKQVPLSLLEDIVELYRPDFTLFDYSPDAYLKMAKPDKLDSSL